MSIGNRMLTRAKGSEAQTHSKKIDSLLLHNLRDNKVFLLGQHCERHRREDDTLLNCFSSYVHCVVSISTITINA